VGILLRGLSAITMLILPLLLLAAWFTIFCHPTAKSLGKPNLFGYDPTVFWKPSDGLTAGVFTLALWMVLVDVMFLAAWAIWKSIKVTVDGWPSVRLFAWAKKKGDSAEIAGGFARVWNWLFWITVVVAFCELQPYVLDQMFHPTLCANRSRNSH
jgi:hypothetical protein